jgi:hypothetical protein
MFVDVKSNQYEYEESQNWQVENIFVNVKFLLHSISCCMQHVRHGWDV